MCEFIPLVCFYINVEPCCFGHHSSEAVLKPVVRFLQRFLFVLPGGGLFKKSLTVQLLLIF